MRNEFTIAFVFDLSQPLPSAQARIAKQALALCREYRALRGRSVGDLEMLDEHLEPAPITSAPTSLRDVDATERAVVVSALEAERWNQTNTARRMGVNRRTVQNLMRKHGIPSARGPRGVATCAEALA